MLRRAGFLICFLFSSALAQTSEPPFYGPLNFGDSRDLVMKKLKKWPYVAFKGSEHLMGRTGMNEVFHTVKDVNGSTFALSFDFGENDKLFSLSLYSIERFKAAEYNTKLKDLYEQTCALVTQVFGPPQRSGKLPEIGQLGRDKTYFPSIYANKGGSLGSIKVGVGLDGALYRVIIEMKYQ